MNQPIPDPQSQAQGNLIQDTNVGGNLIFAPVQIGTKIETQIVQISVAKVTQQPLIKTSPYQGLKKFNFKDRERFFGRDKLIARLFEAVNRSNLSLVLGASGSGKSSLVRAGLMPELSKSLETGQFYDFIFTPNQDPFDSLYRCLQSEEKDYKFSELEAEIVLEAKADTLPKMISILKKKDERWLIFVDQFEELFTYDEPEKCKNFIEGIVKVANSGDRSVKILLAMRSDFLEQLSAYPDLGEIANQNNIHLMTEMYSDELRQAIEQPAAKHGVVFEEGLVEQIIKEVEGQKGFLPLLQYTLNLLWEAECQTMGADGHPLIETRTLNKASYGVLGGVRGALQKHINEVYVNLNQDGQIATKQVFLKLVSIAETDYGIKTVSRRADRDEFVGESVNKILDKFINEKLLVSSSDAVTKKVVISKKNDRLKPSVTIEIAHEILLSSWDVLKTWIEQEKEATIIKNWLASETRRWEKIRSGNESKANDELLKGSRLVQVVELRSKNAFENVGGLRQEEDEFITTSLTQRDRALRRTILGLTSGLLAVSIFAVGAVWQWQRAERQRLITETEALAISASRQFESGGGDITSLLSAMKSGEQLKNLVKDRPLHDYPTVAPLYALQKILDNLYEKNQLRSFSYGEFMSIGDLFPISIAKFSPDGKQIISAYDLGGGIQFYDLSGKEETQNANQLDKRQGELLGPIDMVVSSDGQKIAIIGETGVVNIHDSLRKLIDQKRMKFDQLANHKPYMYSAVISPDMRYVAGISVVENYKAYLWDISGEKIALLGIEDIVNTVSFSPDSKMIATVARNYKGKNSGENITISFWNLSGKLTNSFELNLPNKLTLVEHISFSPNGKQVALSQDDGTTIICNISGEKITQFNGNQGSVDKIIFSPNGQTIATAGSNGTVQIWNFLGEKIHQINGHQGSVIDVNFSPDGQQLITVGSDGILRIWKLNRETQGSEFQAHVTSVEEVSFSENGQIIFTYENAILRIWTSSGELIKQFASGDYDKHSRLVSTPDGFITLDSIENKEPVIKLWDLSGQKKGELRGKSSWYPFQSVFSSPDGQYLILLGNDNIYRLWRFSKQEVIPLYNRLERPLSHWALSPDGQKIIIVDNQRGVELLDSYGKKIREWGGGPIEYEYGIGINFSIDTETKNPVLEDPFVDNSPAKKSDLKKGDRILKINGKSTLGMTREVVSSLLRGSVNTTVTLRISRQGRGEFDLTLNRSVRLAKTRFMEQFYDRVYFSSDSQHIATTSRFDKTVRLWDLFGNQIAKLEGHLSKVIGVVFSPDARFIATTGFDNTVRLWKASGTPLAELKGYQGKLTNVTFSPDSKLVATAGDDGKVRLWSLSGQQIAQLQGSKNQVVSISFSPDGKSIVAGWANGVVRVWRVQGLDELLARGCNWLQEYSTNNPALRAELKVCKDKSVLIEAGREIARTGNVAGAIVKFQEIINIDPQLKLTLEKEAHLLAAPAKLRQGKELVIQGETKQAITAYKEAQFLNSQLKISAYSWGILCRYGSIWGYLKGNLGDYKNEVMDACEKAVAKGGEIGTGYSAEFLQSRGLARAITGDTVGAIKDFESFVKWINDWHSRNSTSEFEGNASASARYYQQSSQTLKWIDTLKKGNNFLTTQEIEQLLEQQPRNPAFGVTSSTVRNLTLSEALSEVH
ncbi:MAG: PDZ domain-containing protein [Microcoleus sp. SU_5_3]|nr:PDZ domain-containing protein [Microcoleus sp. SU_5_3]